MDKSPDDKDFRPKDARLACFGDLARVFPMGPDRLRASPEECLACPQKTQCLAAAASKGKVSLGLERLDREVAAGKTGFLTRWSRKKHLHRLASQQNRD